MNINELKGSSLKKQLGLKRCIKRWHNKNKTGGNFGINLMTDKKHDFELVGYHDLEGKITTLELGYLYSAPFMKLISKNKELNFNEMLEIVKKYINASE